MFKNYFILNRLVAELNKILDGYIITRAFSYEKEKLNLILSKNYSDNDSAIEISVNPGFPYISLRDKASVPKKNIVDFFSDLFPSKIYSVEISDSDRVIRFSLNKALIFFAIRGKFTNAFAVDENKKINSFKKASEEIKNNFLKEVGQINFISSFNNIALEENKANPEEIRKTYPFIGKEILNEINIRQDARDSSISSGKLNEVIQEIKENKPAVFIDENTNEVNLGIKGFKIFPYTKVTEFEKLTNAVNYFLTQHFSRESISDKKKIIEKHLERELKKVTARLNDISARIDRGSQEEDYKKIGELILINIDKIHKGNAEVELTDVYNNNLLKIKINPSISPAQNADYYFEKAKSEKKNFEKSIELKALNEKKFKILKDIEKKFIAAQAPDDYKIILKELKIKTEQTSKPQDEIKRKFRHYIIENKYDVYVGKDNKSNDLLTLKFAGKNDYWFHARAVSGSHVVLKNEKSKEGIPKNILKKAASVAAFHSKAKTSGLAPVSYTQKKYLVKKKGMDPGKVALLKEDVLLVKPEIPEGAEFSED